MSDKYLDALSKFLKDIFNNSNVSMILLSLSKLSVEKDASLQSKEEISQFFLEKITSMLFLKHHELNLLNEASAQNDVISNIS